MLVTLLRIVGQRTQRCRPLPIAVVVQPLLTARVSAPLETHMVGAEKRVPSNIEEVAGKAPVPMVRVF